MHSPESLIHSIDRLGISLWHVDPCRDGSDDSCGRFKRSRHGDKEVLRRIEKRFEEDWDRTWTYDPSEDGDGTPEEMQAGKRTYPRGYFHPEGIPRFSVTGIVLNLFFLTAVEHFKCDGRTGWEKAKRFMRNNLFDILIFAENPTDSLFDSLNSTFGDDNRRDERITQTASIIYGWVLRADQKWWQHPSWHVHHWRVSISAVHKLKRWLFHRCLKCKKRISLRGSPVCHSWDGDGPYTCPSCAGNQLCAMEKYEASPV